MTPKIDSKTDVAPPRGAPAAQPAPASPSTRRRETAAANGAPSRAERGAPTPAGGAKLNKNEATLRHELLRSMLLQRRFEERTAESYALGKIGGFCHLYIGQEAVGTGALSAIRPDDYVITTYRDHGQAIARGLHPRAVMSELYGRIDGCSRGKGGSMHLFDRDLNFFGGHGIVGAHIPIASGIGFAIKYRGGDQVCLCFFGEAAVNGGAFHESLNMAALWRLPVIFVIENNRYGMGTALERASSINNIADRASSYDMPNEVVDGQDVLVVREATQRAVERARREQTPTLLEMRTYRFMGHSMSDAASGTYRKKEELEEYMKRDPITVLRSYMEDAGEISDEEVTALDTELRAIVEDCVQFAEHSAEPPLEALYEDVLVDTTSDAGATPAPSPR